jgi:mono/diheme cytochrome c family protein
MTRCVACHQANGQGVPGVFPPLAGSEWVNGDPDNVIRIVLLGLQGSIDVAGTTYNGVMPGLSAQMEDNDIAAVITHVRSSFGNSATAISSADVNRIRSDLQGRTQPLEASELSSMPAATPAPPATTQTAQAAAPPVQTASTGADGAALFSQFACNTCHSVDDPTPLVGPSLYDVGNRLSRGEIYQSIVDPDAQIADGYAAGMMSAMVGTMNISGAELNRLVDYLASLKG